MRFRRARCCWRSVIALLLAARPASISIRAAGAQAGIIDKLEKQGGKFPITLASVRSLEGEKIAATVFVPEKQRDYYLKKVAAYRDEDRPPNQKGETGPKNETLVASINTVRLAIARSLYTDRTDLFPIPAQ